MEKTILALFVSSVFAASSSLAAEIESLTTPGGARLYHMQVNESEVASIRLHWPSEWMLDDGLNPAVPQITAQAIQTGGAGRLDREEKAEAFQNLEVKALIGSTATMVRAEVLVPVGNLDEMAALVNTVLTRPAFDRQRLEEIKESVTSELEALRGNPQFLSGQLAGSLLYPDSPLRRFSAGINGDAVQGVAREDVVDFHDRTLTRRDASVVMAGPFDAGRASALADAMLQDLPEGGGAEFPDADAAVPHLTVVLHEPDADNSLLILIGELEDGSTSDFLADQIALGMFAQSPGSVLNNALRAEFGGNPNFIALPVALSPTTQLIQLSGESDTANLPLTLATVRESYSGFRDNGPTTSIELWKNFLVQTITQAANNVHVQTLQIEENLIRGIPADSMLNMASELEAVTGESLAERLRAAFPSVDEFLTIVITPDPDAVAGACVIAEIDDYVSCLPQRE